jgi:hypothetical protein
MRRLAVKAIRQRFEVVFNHRCRNYTVYARGRTFVYRSLKEIEADTPILELAGVRSLDGFVVKEVKEKKKE